MYPQKNKKSSSSPTDRITIKRRQPNAKPPSASPGSTAVPLESKRPKVTPVTSEKRGGPRSEARSEKARSRGGGYTFHGFVFGGVVSPFFLRKMLMQLLQPQH